MTKISSNDGRQDWSTPELRKIRAGSAEAKVNTGVNDGGTPPSKDKS
ncbi:MAG: hypothetical protein ABIN83_07915 [Sphingomicrobium sp.]